MQENAETGNFDENEFVIIDHPKGDKVAKDPFLTEKDDGIKPDVAEIVSQEQQPVLEDKMESPFDAVFGVVENQEDEPVMVSSFTDESDRFTNSTNSSTHRVAPSKSRQIKKPPAPPPQQRNITMTTPSVVNNDFDTIFGTPTMHNETSCVSETNNNTSIQVTPTTKTVPFDQTFNQSNNDKEVIDPKGEKQGVDGGVKEENNETTSLSTKKGEKKKKKNIVSWAKSFGGFDFSHTEDDKKKKKKDKKKAKETPPVIVNKKENNTTSVHSNNEVTSSEQPPAPINNNSIPAYDLDTIQGSHIAELVNMGFEPAAALEALDRYDQDIGKATNFLLDQIN